VKIRTVDDLSKVDGLIFIQAFQEW
jgi:hypothetical protein